MTQPHEERLQKVLAQAGIASRRASETMIEQGRITVNGQTVTVQGFKVNPRRDIIAVDGRELPKLSQKPVYLILNKPRDVLTTVRDDRGRRTVVDLVEAAERVYPVGRLDLKSEGLVLLTNDGELAEKLTHPRSHVEKEYQALVAGRPTTPTLIRWRRGEIEVEGQPTERAVVERLKIEGDNTWLKIILTEGRKRQIREVGQALGHRVLRLERVRIGPIKLGHLKPGKWRHLNPSEVEQLKRSVKL